MKKHAKRKKVVVTPQDKPDIANLIDKIQQQLSTVEKKLDILISQSSKRPFEKSYSQKPFRSFNRFSRNDRGRQGNNLRERTFTRVICADCNKECEVPFKPSGDRPVYCKECFPKHKKNSFFNENRSDRPEERNFPKKRHSDKKPAEKRRKPAEKKQKPANKKPFYSNIKKRH